MHQTSPVGQRNLSTIQPVTKEKLPPKPNLTLEEQSAIKELKEDHSPVVLTADKGVTIVVMYREDYTDKALSLLAGTNTYKNITKDPTTKLKNKLSQTLKDIKNQGGLSDQSYRKVYPTSAAGQKFYDLPKIHKIGIPLRPIVSSRGSITYGVTKELANIIHHLVAQAPHHLKYTQHFTQHMKEVKLEPGEVMTSYDVKAFFTSVTMDPSISIIKQKLQQDPLLSQRTNMSIQQIVTLLEFCLKNTYFHFQGKDYKQVHCTAMGSPISPFLANLFMEKFKVQTLSSAPHPPPMAKVCG